MRLTNHAVVAELVQSLLRRIRRVSFLCSRLVSSTIHDQQSQRRVRHSSQLYRDEWDTQSLTIQYSCVCSTPQRCQYIDCPDGPPPYRRRGSATAPSPQPAAPRATSPAPTTGGSPANSFEAPPAAFQLAMQQSGSLGLVNAESPIIPALLRAASRRMDWLVRPSTHRQAALTRTRAGRERGLAFTTISTSCPSATRKRIRRSTEKPSSL